MLETTIMRTRKLHFSEDALPTFDTFLKRTAEARVFRRAQAVRDVVTGQRLQTVSETRHLTYAALRTWVQRFATEGTRGLLDRPRSGRPLQSHLRVGTVPQSPRRPRPPGAWLPLLPVALSRARHCLRTADRCPTRPCTYARCVKKTRVAN